jgi:hypothetical protein
MTTSKAIDRMSLWLEPEHLHTLGMHSDGLVDIYNVMH